MNAPRPQPEDLLHHATWIRELARKLVRDESRRDDVVQDAWVAALTTPRDRIGDLRAWLGGVISNAVRFERRGEENRAHREHVASKSEATPPVDELIAQAELQKRLVELVLELDEPYRETLLLRFFKELSPQAIAKRTGVPASTVRNRLKRGLEKLRERLDRDHHGDRNAWTLAFLGFLENGREPLLAAAVLGGLLVNLKLVLSVCGVAIVAATALYLSNTDNEPLSPEADADLSEARPKADLSEPAGANVRASDVTNGIEEAETEVALAAEPEPGYTGRVVDTRGNGIPNALLTVVDLPVIDSHWTATEAHTRTLEDGTFAFERELRANRLVQVWGFEGGGFELGSDRTLHLFCEAEGFAPRQVDLPEGELGTIVLRDASVVFGTVVDKATGAPLAGCELSFEDFDWKDGALRKTVTDVAGRYRFERMTSEKRSLWVTARPENAVPVRRDLVTGPGETRFDLAIEAGHVVRGRVIDLPGGRPVADAVVRAEFTAVARTNAAGEFEVRGLRAGVQRIEVAKPGFGATHAEVDPATSDSLELPLLRECRVTGRLVTAQGEPVPRARVVLLIDREFDWSAAHQAYPNRIAEYVGFSQSSLHSTRSDANGLFVLEGLSPWVRYTKITAIDSRSGRSVSHGPIVFEAPGEAREVELTIADDSAVLYGELTQAGQPLQADLTWISANSRGDGESDANGRYRLEGVEPGEITLRIFSQETGYATRRKCVAIAGTETQCDVAIELGRSVLAGRLTTKSGEATEAYWLFAQSQVHEDARGQVLPAEDGSFRMTVTGDDGDAYKLRLNFGLLAVEQEVHAGDEAIEFIVPELRIVALDARIGGEPAEEIRVAWRRDGEGEFDAIYPSSVRYQEERGWLVRLPVGTHDLRIASTHGDGEPVVLEGVEVTLDETMAAIPVSLQE